MSTFLMDVKGSDGRLSQATIYLRTADAQYKYNNVITYWLDMFSQYNFKYLLLRTLWSCRK